MTEEECTLYQYLAGQKIIAWCDVYDGRVDLCKITELDGDHPDYEIGDYVIVSNFGEELYVYTLSDEAVQIALEDPERYVYVEAYNLAASMDTDDVYAILLSCDLISPTSAKPRDTDVRVVSGNVCVSFRLIDVKPRDPDYSGYLGGTVWPTYRYAKRYTEEYGGWITTGNYRDSLEH